MSAGWTTNLIEAGRAEPGERVLRSAATRAYGGDNEATIHVDMIFSAPRVEADGRPIELP